jgi:hypothetical protein
MDQMVDVMVGYSNLGLVDALRSAESAPCGAWGVRRHGRITSDRVDLGRRRPRSVSRGIHHGGEVRHAVTHVVLTNDELAKISREQVAAERPVWQTSLVNPDFAAYADLCGGRGFRVDRPEDLKAIFEEALSLADAPSLVEVRTSPRWT